MSVVPACVDGTAATMPTNLRHRNRPLRLRLGANVLGIYVPQARLFVFFNAIFGNNRAHPGSLKLRVYCFPVRLCQPHSYLHNSTGLTCGLRPAACLGHISLWSCGFSLQISLPVLILLAPPGSCRTMKLTTPPPPGTRRKDSTTLFPKVLFVTFVTSWSL